MGKTYRRSKRYFDDDVDGYYNETKTNGRASFRKERQQEHRAKRMRQRTHDDTDGRWKFHMNAK